MADKAPVGKVITDEELIELLRRDTSAAWTIFIERFSDHVFTQLRRMGFDHDDAMERFVYVFERLSEDDCRRLTSIKTLEPTGNLKAWLNKVIRNLSINWAWSENGRNRLLGFVAEMPAREQRIFQLFFWQGKTPFEIFEILRLEHDQTVAIEDVFRGLENVTTGLSEKKRWRLLSNLNRGRRELSLEIDSETNGLGFEPVDMNSPNPEERTVSTSAAGQLLEAARSLTDKEKLVVSLRYEEALTLKEVAEVLGWDQRDAVNLHKSALYKLRKYFGSERA